MRWGKGFAILALFVVALAFTTSSSVGVSSGISGATLPKDGCTCHGPGGAEAKKGVPSNKVVLFFEVDGNPMKYKPGSTYNLTFGAKSSDVPPADDPALNKGGFNLRVSTGVLKPKPGQETLVKVASPLEATHTSDGDKAGRTYHLLWTAPTDTETAAIFTLFANTVNGDSEPSELDHWNGATFVILGPSGEIGGAVENPSEFGVRYFAHWVGVISFVAVIATLLLYYFVLKYGETVHATDHRDRKEK